MGGDPDCKIYVGGLAPETTTDVLERHFLKFGDIADCIVMTDKVTDRSRGFGFVTFRDRSSANDALGSTNHIDGRDVSTKKAVSEGKSSSAGSNLVQDQGNTFNAVKIFVGGLPASCDQDKLNNYFSKYGRIVDSVVMMDQQTQRHRGFGYCTFDECAAVEAAMREYADHKIDGKWIEVKRCIPQDKMGGGDRRGSDRGRGRSRSPRDRRDRDDRSSLGSDEERQRQEAWAAYYRGMNPYAMGYAHPAYGGYPGYPAYGGYPGMPQGAYGGYPGMPGYPQDPRMAQAYGAPPPPGGGPPPVLADAPPDRHPDDRR